MRVEKLTVLQKEIGIMDESVCVKIRGAKRTSRPMLRVSGVKVILTERCERRELRDLM